jgi:hypothetical protein
MNSYYVNSHGDSPYIRPSTELEARWRSTHFPLDDYVYQPAPCLRRRSAHPSISLEAQHA